MSAVRGTAWARGVFVAVAAVGLGVSALLLYEYVSPTAQLCGAGGGCDRVRHSAFASLLGAPTPAFGVAFFSLALTAVLWRRARPWLLPLALLGGLAGVGFVALQAFAIGAWCKLCLVADAASVALSIAGWRIARGGEGRLSPAIAAPLIVVCAALPILVGAALAERADVGGPLPEVIAREQRAGVATIVEFLDFECPYCREQHLRMKPLLDEHGERVRVLYKHVPLASHRHARDAARAWICADEQGRGAALADALLTGVDLSPRGCAEAAERVGVDMTKYAECLESARPDARIAADREDATAIGLRGLPTFFVGSKRFEGLAETDVVRAALARALAAATREQ